MNIRKACAFFRFFVFALCLRPVYKKTVKNIIFSLFFALFVGMAFFSCRSAPVITEIEAGAQRQNRGGAASLTQEIRSLTETGILPKMVQALDIIRNNNLGGTEFGRVMNAINAAFISKIYPGSGISLPFIDLPQTHIYARIMRQAEMGNYPAPSANSGSFFEHILPFLAIFDETSPARLLPALPDLERARQLSPNSVLPHYFRGLVLERSGRLIEANAAYNQALEIYDGFFPALAGIARLAGLWGRKQEAAELFSDLAASHPGNIWIKRQFAAALYENNELSRAQPLITEILQENPHDWEFLLMYAHVMIEQRQFNHAQNALGSYSALNPGSRQYLFLRARVQAEGFRNRDSAMSYLNSILRSNPADEEAGMYAIRLLMGSPCREDQEEGRRLLRRLRDTSGSPIVVLTLGLIDVMDREDWQAAQNYLSLIFAIRRSAQDLIDAYTVERGLGSNERAFAFARELYELDPSNYDAILTYISALIDTGRREEALRMIEGRLAANTAIRSQLFFLRSRLQRTNEAAIGDLRASLLEDARNLETLIAMFEIHHHRGETRRAAHYLRQALMIAPGSPRLARFEREYASILNP